MSQIKAKISKEVAYADALNRINKHSGKALNLSGFKLASVPPEIGHLHSLQVLSLDHNQLTSIPSELGRLQSLKALYLNHNQLTSLPPEINQLTKLEQLFLHENPGLELPLEVLGPSYEECRANQAKPASPKAILDFYFARRSEGVSPMREVRLIIIGRGRVGKTSLLKALRSEKPDSHEPETPGITITSLKLASEQGEATCHVWDFGGQEFLHGNHQIFLSHRCIYVLVLEGRESNWELETDYWLRFIQSFGGDSPIIIALNKYDAHPFSVDRFRLQERCPQITAFIETDAFTKRGISELRGQIQKTVSEMPSVWEGLPKSYHRVKEALTKMDRSFLEYADYQKLCGDLKISDAEKQDVLAQNLHHLGIALNFRDHHRLRNTSVLKPSWVTEGIYGLLRFAQKQDRSGTFKREWIGQALPVKDYPVAKHTFIMELMEKFEVAFALEAKDAKKESEPNLWLIPELLPEAQPQAFAEFRQRTAKRLRFTYPEALPPGLLPRFIVRTHEMSAKHAEWRWRSGVILEWANSRALVRLDRQQRLTEVDVIDGSPEEQQSLFDVIRNHLSELHGNIRVLEEVQALDGPEKWIDMRELRMAERDFDHTIKVTIGDESNIKRVLVKVDDTLNKVQSEAARVAASPDAPPRLKLFISYAHDNEKELAPFKQHLALLSARGYIQYWQERDLIAGEEWKKEILEQLDSADIVLLFYTTAARVSKFMQETEIPIALKRSDEKKCAVIWVPLERKDLNKNHPLESRLSYLQCATKDATPIYDFDPHQIGWMQVEEAIQKTVEKRRSRS